MNVSRSFEEPDESVEFGGVTEELITIAGLTVSRSTQPAGWRWSKDLRPLVGGEWCQAHHVGLVLSGLRGSCSPTIRSSNLVPGTSTTFRLGTTATRSVKSRP